MTKPFPMIERAVVELIETKFPALEGRVGGDLSYEQGQPAYVWLGLIPGGSADQIEGSWALDIDIFAPTYTEAMQLSLNLGAALIGPKHRTSIMLIDNVYQNEVPLERPWSAEQVYRVGATYVFTARRSG